MKLLALITLSVTIFASCAENRQAARRSHLDSPQTLGTGDSGGGNLYKGRPIESYRVDITQHPAYKSKVAPILRALIGEDRHVPGIQTSHPDLGRMFLSIIHKRTWYFIPGPLEGLPEKRTGIAVPTEQGALQSPEEIWINSLLFNSMSEEEQGKLILHEILMGLRILKFASDYRQCLSFAPSTDYCDNRSKHSHGDISQLTPKDYADVRSAGIQILTSFQNLTYADWEDLMASRSFSLPERDFLLKTDQGIMKRENFMSNVKRAFITKTAPSYGVKWGRPILTENCNIELREMSEQNTFEVILNTPTQKRRIKMDLSKMESLTFYKNTSFNQKKLAHILIYNYSPPPGAKVGDRYVNIRFLFNSDDFVGVEFEEMVYTSLTGTGSFDSETPGDALRYLCANEEVSLQ